MKPGCLSLEEVERNFIFLGSLLFDTAVDHNPDPGATSHPTRFHPREARQRSVRFDLSRLQCRAVGHFTARRHTLSSARGSVL
jgi:hypothetical protein